MRPASESTIPAMRAPERFVLGNGLYEQSCYNDRLQPEVMRLGTAAGTTNCPEQGGDSLRLVLGYGPGANNNGNIVSQAITPQAGTSFTQAYGYDGLNRLKQLSESGVVRDYFYSHTGNRWVTSNVSMPLGTPAFQTDYALATNRLTKAGSDHDLAGNMTAIPFGPSSITWDAAGRAINFQGASFATYGFRYDADDRRVRKADGNGEVTLYVYDAFGKLAAEFSTVEPTGPAGLLFRTVDHLGSTRVVTDESQTVLSRRDFYPFGERIDDTVGSRGSFNAYGGDDVGFSQLFTGKERDGESGLDYRAPLVPLDGAPPRILLNQCPAG